MKVTCSLVPMLICNPYWSEVAGIYVVAPFRRPLGVLELLILALYLTPRTAVLGAVILTGLLGGAVATHLRLMDPLFSHVLFGVYVGVLAWGGLYLRETRLRELLPLAA